MPRSQAVGDKKTGLCCTAAGSGRGEAERRASKLWQVGVCCYPGVFRPLPSRSLPGRPAGLVLALVAVYTHQLPLSGLGIDSPRAQELSLLLLFRRHSQLRLLPRRPRLLLFLLASGEVRRAPAIPPFVQRRRWGHGSGACPDRGRETALCVFPLFLCCGSDGDRLTSSAHDPPPPFTLVLKPLYGGTIDCFDPVSVGEVW